MTLLWPVSLLGLLPTLAAALWALRRPERNVAVVGSLELWQAAVEAVDPALRRPRRRLSTSWALLLAGALAAVAALARPVLYSGGRGRRVAVVLHNAAELAGTDFRPPVRAFLQRLDPGDRVTLLSGGGQAKGDNRARYVTPAEALRQAERLAPRPIAAGRLALPEPPDDAGLVVHFAPAGAAEPAAPDARLVEMPAGETTALDALAATTVDGEVEVFAAVWNAAGVPLAGRLVVEPVGGGTLAATPLSAPANGRGQAVCTLPAAEGFAVRVADADGRQRAAGYLARSPERTRRVAMIGADEPVLRRFVSADPALDPVAEPARADLVIANRRDPPGGVAALVIDPPTAPPGWRRGEARRAVALGNADLAPGDPLLRGVTMSAAAVRVVRPWRAIGRPPQVVAASLDGEALLLRHAPPRGPRRVYVACVLSTANTNLAVSESLVILLANAVRWLVPRREPGTGYEDLRPLAAAGLIAGGARRVAGRPPEGADDHPLPWPGLFRDGERLLAVSLPGLRPARPGRPPAEAVAAIRLPPPRPLGGRVEWWPWLAAAALGLWLAGWTFRRT